MRIARVILLFAVLGMMLSGCSKSKSRDPIAAIHISFHDYSVSEAGRLVVRQNTGTKWVMSSENRDTRSKSDLASGILTNATLSMLVADAQKLGVAPYQQGGTATPYRVMMLVEYEDTYRDTEVYVMDFGTLAEGRKLSAGTSPFAQLLNDALKLPKSNWYRELRTPAPGEMIEELPRRTDPGTP